MLFGVTGTRALALQLLQRIENDGAYANLVVPAALATSGLESRDRAFVTELVYGTTRMRRACDAVVDRFVLSEPDAATRSVLRLGAYQLVFAGVPPHAAVGETVAIAPKRTRGFVNAVLRKVSRLQMVWPDEATQLSYPDWIVERLRVELGDADARAALMTMNEPPPVSVRDDGYTQDRSSQWVAAAVGALPGEQVLDLCAAPGGKATAMAARSGHDGAFVIAADVSRARTGLIRDNLTRVGADGAAVCADGTMPPFVASSFDRVLLDAPCSGLGALRRRPDSRWRITAADITELAALQRMLLTSAATLVRPGGTLVYSVCTLTAEESIDHSVPLGFSVVDARPEGMWRPYGHGWRVLPHDDDTDGMVLVRYRRDA
jgi:16S rRNA (cytosine967-C5)-methyltransferase